MSKAVNSEPFGDLSLAAQVNWRELGTGEHLVQFYENDSFLLHSLSEFIAAGLSTGEAAIVVATADHRNELDARLVKSGFDVEELRKSGQYLSFDAAETLTKIMKKGSPDPVLFADTIGSLISSASKLYPQIRIYGEMVALLWADGNAAGAIQLEELWNQLHKAQSFSLLCGYPMTSFDGEAAQHLADVCTNHSRLIPSDGYSSLPDGYDRLRTVVELQQKARALELEVSYRKELERKLRDALADRQRAQGEALRRQKDLQDFLESAVEGIHWVGADGRILWANKAELHLLGYSPEEYIGHDIREFHTSAEVVEDILDKLGRNETLVDYEARLRCRDGSTRDVLISSNVKWEDGRFSHTCCFNRDVTERKRAEQAALWLGAMVESAEDAVIGKTLDGIITTWNAGAERLFGYSAAEIVGKSVTVLIPPDRRHEEPEILNKLSQGVRIEHYETERLRKDGTRIDISLTVSPIKDNQNRIVGASKIARDITERKKAEASMNTLKLELETQVEDLRRLHDVSVNLTRATEVETILQEVLKAALAAQNTEMGFLSMCTPTRDGLHIKVSSGFDQQVLDAVAFVPVGVGACGKALETGSRFLVEDCETEPALLPFREFARKAGFRAVHSIPLINRNGQTLGVLSAHFRHPRKANEREMRLMDLYARMAADFIDAARLHGLLKKQLEERERMLLREQTLRLEAEHANRLKDEFLATVSHELRTPLNAIIGWSHMLKEGTLDAVTATRALESIERNAKAQAQLIEDLLDVSRIVIGKLHLNVSTVDLASVITSAAEALQLAADAKAVKVEVRLDLSTRHISGDATRLQQIVWNLLSNAIKFTPSGGSVLVTLRRAGPKVELAVSDTGQGISKEFLPFIFERFTQADAAATRRHGGLGLGLAIVRNLAELHGGTVEAQSEGPGKGSSFIVALPVLVDSNALSEIKSRERKLLGPVGRGTVENLGQFMLDGVRVLVVDDDMDTLGMLTSMLTACSATVQVASSAAEATNILEWFRPEILVSDLAMPEVDGYSLIRAVRQREKGTGSCLYAIALTAFGRVEDHAKALSAGFNMFVAKPFEPRELLSAIASLVKP